MSEKLREQAKLIADMVTTVLTFKGKATTTVKKIVASQEFQAFNLIGNTYDSLKQGVCYSVTIEDDNGTSKTIAISVLDGDTHSIIRNKIETAL